MANEQPISEEAYGTLAGPVNEFMVQRIFSDFTIAINKKVKVIHLLFQSTGGSVGDGIAIYNYIRNLPIEVIAYNGGSVQSIAVVSFLGAKERKASKTATFMIHRTKLASNIPATSRQLEAAAESIAVDDRRTEFVLHEHIKMPSDKWKIHKDADLVITADQALKYGIIDEITDFLPKPGATIFNLVGVQ